MDSSCLAVKIKKTVLDGLEVFLNMFWMVLTSFQQTLNFYDLSNRWKFPLRRYVCACPQHSPCLSVLKWITNMEVTDVLLAILSTKSDCYCLLPYYQFRLSSKNERHKIFSKQFLCSHARIEWHSFWEPYVSLTSFRY